MFSARCHALCAVLAISAAQADAQALDEQDIFNLGREVLRNLPSTQEQKSRQPTQEPGQRYDAATVREIQLLLGKLGYSAGPADGIPGSRTAQAIRSFQRDFGIQQSGEPTAQLLGQIQNVLGSSRNAQTVPRPSFDCARAGTPTEHAICSSVELSEKDRRLAELYKLALAQSPTPDAVKQQQRGWIAERDGCGSDVHCLADAMDSRAGQLSIGSDTAAAKEGAVTSHDQAIGGDAPPAGFDDGIYLVRDASLFEDGNVVFYDCLEPHEAQSLSSLLGSFVRDGHAVTGQLPIEGGALATILVTQGDNTQVVVGGDCVEQVLYTLNSQFDRARNEFEVIAIVERAKAGTQANEPQATAIKDFSVNADNQEEPFLRVYLPEYLAKSTRQDREELFVRYIQALHGNRDYGETEVFAAGEIKDREPAFLANQAFQRWDTALHSLGLDLPVVVTGQVELRNYKYDFENGTLIFPSYHEDGQEGHLFMLQPRAGYVYEASAFDKQAKDSFLLRFLRQQKPFNTTIRHRMIRSDRQIILPKVSMAPEFAESLFQGPGGKAIIVADVGFEITQIGEPSKYGDVAMEGTFLGMNLRTDSGEQLLALKPEDLPSALDEEQKETETVRQAEPEESMNEVNASDLAVAGITLGMSSDNALAELADIGSVIYKAEVAPATGEFVQDRYQLAVLENGETFAFHVSGAQERSLIGLARKIPYEKGVSISALRDAFVNAYGEPVVEEDDSGFITWRWERGGNQSAANVPCATHFIDGLHSGSVPKLVNEERDDQALLTVLQGAQKALQYSGEGFFRSYISERAPRIHLSMKEKLDGCAPFLNVRVMPSQTNQNQIWVHLVDPQAFVRELENASSAEPEASFDSKL